MSRSRWLRTARTLVSTFALGAALAAGTAFAQGTTPIRILVGFPAGGGTDAIARTLADKLKDQLGQPVVVDNRAGAGGQIAAQALKAAAPDGHTLFLTHDHTVSILPLVTKNPGFDPAKDFVAVAGFATFVNALAVSTDTPVKSIPEYVAWVKGQGQGKGTVGVPAPASTPEFLVKLLGQKYALDLQAAPYRGSAPLIADMLGNQIPAGVGSVPDFIENHKAGKIRVISVLSTQRQAVMPEVPAIAELGVSGFEEPPYYGLFAPAGTPPALIEKYSQALDKVLAMPDVKARLTAMGLRVDHMSPPQLATRQKVYTEAWAKLIKTLGVVPQ